MTVEQLEAARSERMRLNGHSTLTLEDARTWVEETGLCLFLPKRQLSTAVAPSFVEAVMGQQEATPEPRHIAHAEELLVRLERDGVAVRLNLQGQPGEQPDFVVATWVLPYVYALRGDRDWRRNPQLTGSRQVSPLAVQAYKLLEAGDASVASLKHTLGREVTDAAVMRAITELWQQLRIIPTIEAPGKAAKWQLLRQHHQKAIAEGASTSQVTAISVLASIYLQAVIAASMEDVEFFLAPLTARSKIREVIRGLVSTRQVHSVSLGHSPHFYVAGTLPEFSAPLSAYSFASLPASSYFSREDDYPHISQVQTIYTSNTVSTNGHTSHANSDHSEPAHADNKVEPAVPSPVPHVEKAPPAAAKPVHRATPAAKSTSDKPRISRPVATSRDRKPAQKSSDSGRSLAKTSAAQKARPTPQKASARPAAKGTSSRNAKPVAKSSVKSFGGNKVSAKPASKSVTASRKPASLSKHKSTVAASSAKHGSKKTTMAAKPLKRH